jgi:hypothetical protein
MNLAKVQNLKLVLDSTCLHVGPTYGAAIGRKDGARWRGHRAAMVKILAEDIGER